MTSQALHDFSTLLLHLYRLSHELPIDAFQDAALELIKPVLPFDASMWGTASTASEGIDVHTLHLHRKTPEMMMEYDNFKHLDSAAASFFGKGHGTRGFNSASWWSEPKYAPFLDYVRRYDQNNIFITMDSDPRTNFMHWFSLFRADPDAHCRPEEVSLLASLSPHMMQALALNRLMHLGRTLSPASGSQPRGSAIADLKGAIYHCDVTFVALMQEEFPGWPRQALPSSLQEHFMTEQCAYMGRHVAVSYRLEQRLLFLSVRKRCRADGLTPREHTVAELLARGDTHKDIAAILNRSPATVRNHIQSIYDKLQVGNVAGLIQELRLAG
ncbi:helix-turn-helix domain-containing protein [Variovorax paradoxus]|uniref:helix-turn-helix domain-containing protein n=1 Tax=Variovorax paradoxus TaxID=34073 RepID=UPI00277FAF8B|nr:helix-turn-helix transcriptional regulator [Variovorax paradoxus]MDQ0588119.1 DNA-binding CsgD family transcriptional regulator [Variovorax paradoxus]